jgi:hypothetical protein
MFDNNNLINKHGVIWYNNKPIGCYKVKFDIMMIW